MSVANPFRSSEAQAFVVAFDAWSERPSAEGFPYAAAMRAIRSGGKHLLADCVADRLAGLRQGRNRIAGDPADQRLMDGFLDCALDKREGRYDYASYCALKLLALPDADQHGLPLSRIVERRDRALIGLLGDLLRFERDAAAGREPFLPQMRPSPDLSRRRCRLSLAAMKPSLQRMACPTEAGSAGVEDAVRIVLDWRDGWLTDGERCRLDLSLQPVHVVHDEYLFLRILQSFEVNFAWIAVLLRGAIDRMDDDAGGALARLRLCNTILREAARLFPLIASMRVEAFRDFRRFTEGASAIQSSGYKNVEALCRCPDPERLNSAAFASVPDVRAAASGGQRSLDAAFAQARRSGLPAAICTEIAAELETFAAQLLRWRQAHYQIAKRFLGDLGGTGYTQGVPYLAEVRNVPVFRDAAIGQG